MEDVEEAARRDAWVAFLDRWHWDLFCTLTFAREIHPEAADKRFRVWLSKINRELHGPRWFKHGKGARWVRALEYQRRGVIHFHALLGGDDVRSLRRLSLKDSWEELAGFARIEPPRDGGAVRGYVSKYVTKDGEIDLGGPGMHDAPYRWAPGRLTRPKPTPIEAGIQLAQLRAATSADEWSELQAWAASDARTKPAVVNQVRTRLSASADETESDAGPHTVESPQLK